MGFNQSTDGGPLNSSQGSVAAGQRLICVSPSSGTGSSECSPPALCQLPLFSCCLEFPLPHVHLASGSPALKTQMLSALIMLSSEWANWHFLGEFTAVVSFPGQQSGSSLALGRLWHRTGSKGQQSPQQEAPALSHPKMCVSAQFVWQNPSSVLSWWKQLLFGLNFGSFC